MVRKLKCDCNDRTGAVVNSSWQFKELKDFFAEQVSKEIFVEDANKRPFYIWRSMGRVEEHYATKWYRCQECGCLWEFDYPAFPAKGFVRKYENGDYTGTEIVDRTE